MNETLPKYRVMDELKKPWLIVSVLFIALFLVTFFVLNSQLPDHLSVQWSNSNTLSLSPIVLSFVISFFIREHKPY